MGGFPVLTQFSGRYFGVLNGFLQMILQGVIGKMQQVALEPADGSGCFEFVVGIVSAPLRLGPAHQSQPPFGVPGVPNPFAKIMGAAIYQKSGFTAGLSRK